MLTLRIYLEDGEGDNFITTRCGQTSFITVEFIKIMGEELGHVKGLEFLFGRRFSGDLFKSINELIKSMVITASFIKKHTQDLSSIVSSTIGKGFTKISSTFGVVVVPSAVQ